MNFFLARLAGSKFGMPFSQEVASRVQPRSAVVVPSDCFRDFSNVAGAGREVGPVRRDILLDFTFAVDRVRDDPLGPDVDSFVLQFFLPFCHQSVPQVEEAIVLVAGVNIVSFSGPQSPGSIGSQPISLSMLTVA